MQKLLNATILRTTKQVIQMAESKAILFFLNLIGIPFYGYTLFINLDNAKGWVLTGLAIVFICARIYFYIKKSNQALRKAEFELKEMERQERIKARQESTQSTTQP